MHANQTFVLNALDSDTSVSEQNTVKRRSKRKNVGFNSKYNDYDTRGKPRKKYQKCDRLSSDVEPLSMTVSEHLLAAELARVNEPFNERLLVAEDIPPEELLPTVQQLSVREQLPSADIDEHSDLPGDGPPAVETEEVPLDEQLHPVEDVPLQELLPTVQQLSVCEQLPSADIDEQSRSVNLRDKSVAMKKIKCVVAEQYSSGDEFLTDSDDYVPSDGEHRVCGIPHCSNDIFLGCLHCVSFLCYNHMDTVCTEHTRLQQATSTESLSSVESTHTNLESMQRIKKRNRSRRVNTTRQYRSNPKMWKKNKRKHARLAGQQYVNTSGKIIPQKMIKPCVCRHGRQCIFRCATFSDDMRKTILSEYYATADFSRQRDFVFNHTSFVTAPCHKRKHKSVKYWLPLDGVKVRVCKKMFLTTLDISEKLVTYTLSKRTSGDVGMTFSSPDMRGKHVPSNKTDANILDGIRQHINSFPKMAPHYCRADTNRQFLGADLNIRKMYELYVESRKSAGELAAKEGVYRKIFCSEFNLSFHRPKKDLCSKCEKYDNADDKVPLEEEHLLHLSRKKQAQDEKTADKERAAKNSDWLVLTADLQSVLSTPCGNVSSLYYSRKLSVYNFTLYNQVTGDGYCYVWNETQAQRGANEIGSVLFLFLKENLHPGVKHVVITSDSTVSQNRNHLVACCLLLAVQTLPEIVTIEQKFLEIGHTHMEVDAMHATIDTHRKNLKISSPDEWPVVLQTARRGKPYSVREMEQYEFYDMHELASGLKATKLKTAIPWMKVKCLRVQKGVTNAVEIKENYSDNYQTVFVGANERPNRKARKMSNACAGLKVDEALLKRAYMSPLPVSAAKKSDLLKLCASGAIKPKFHAFYHSLTTSDSVRDCLPQPDCCEDTE